MVPAWVLNPRTQLAAMKPAAYRFDRIRYDKTITHAAATRACPHRAPGGNAFSTETHAFTMLCCFHSDARRRQHARHPRRRATLSSRPALGAQAATKLHKHLHVYSVIYCKQRAVASSRFSADTGVGVKPTGLRGSRLQGHALQHARCCGCCRNCHFNNDTASRQAAHGADTAAARGQPSPRRRAGRSPRAPIIGARASTKIDNTYTCSE